MKENATLTNKPYLSRKETAFYLGLNCQTLDKIKIPHVKLGRRVVYSKQAVDAWYSEHSKGATDERA